MPKQTDKRAKRDPEDMLGAILAWPDRLRAGLETARQATLPDALGKAEAVYVAAMGGSAIAASLAADYLSDAITVPFTVVRDYGLPAAAGKRSLVIAVSHSGSTEETLAAFRQAGERGARRLAITGTPDGPLATAAGADGAPTLVYDCPGQPRAALPMGLGLWLGVLGRLGYAPDQAGAVESAAGHLDELTALVKSTEANLGHTVAEKLAGRIPIVYGAGFLADTARRVKGQISENGKTTAAWEVLPEQNHNALVGYDFPEGLRDAVVFVLLRSSLEHPRHAARFEFLKDLLSRHRLDYVEIPGSGPDKLSHLASVAFWGDLASYDLAVLNGVDPTPVEVIGELKAYLAEQPA